MSMPKGYNAETGTMTFSLALDEMRAGRKVRRRAWPDHESYRIAASGDVFITAMGFHVQFIDSRDMLADDWETVL